jgi:mRNA interferase YafQ
MQALKRAIRLLVANDGPLGPARKDHALTGDWAGFRECQIGGDFLLIDRLDDDAGKRGTVVFVRIGSHAELFE